MSFKIIHVKHHHCVFTIAEELRPFFLNDRSLLNCLLSEGGIGKSVLWRGKTHFNYVFMRNAFQTALLNELKKKLPGRPVIATSRIDKYDTENNTVTFHYNQHEDDKYVEETLSAMDFIKRLIQHIPEKHFKQIRYYGIYARKHIGKCKFNFAIHKSKHKFILSLNRWRNCIAASFGYGLFPS